MLTHYGKIDCEPSPFPCSVLRLFSSLPSPLLNLLDFDAT